ncbi:MAG: DUF268 domain-containing protein [Lachnospiraceae bacterium]|nr:DUF268 domain-containing protein [Lachnospiraceae bacterium]
MRKLLVWGIGNYARRFIENQCNEEIIGFIETNKSTDTYMGKPVYDSREIPDGIDYIIIANSYATEIYNWCLRLKIDTTKLIFLYGVKQQMGCTDSHIIKSVLSNANYTIYCAEFGIIDQTFVKSDAEEYQMLNRRSNFAIQEQYMWPIIVDKYAPAGRIQNYFWQDLWAARLVIKSGIKNHFDIGSRLDGFIAHLLAAQIDVTMIDIRKFPGEVEHLHAIVDDATTLHQIPDESIGSMSALCSLEHFGLGRYGDPIDPEACFKCFENIQKKLKKGGRLYLSLPIGKERVEFNAHRVFYARTVAECFHTLHLAEFSCTAEGKIEYNVDIHKYDNDSHNGEWRYGLFSFIK